MLLLLLLTTRSSLSHGLLAEGTLLSCGGGKRIKKVNEQERTEWKHLILTGSLNANKWVGACGLGLERILIGLYRRPTVLLCCVEVFLIKMEPQIQEHCDPGWSWDSVFVFGLENSECSVHVRRIDIAKEEHVLCVNIGESQWSCLRSEFQSACDLRGCTVCFFFFFFVPGWSQTPPTVMPAWAWMIY